MKSLNHSESLTHACSMNFWFCACISFAVFLDDADIDDEGLLANQMLDVPTCIHTTRSHACKIKLRGE